MTTQQLQKAQALPLAVPGDDLDAYIRAVNSVPVLSVEEERQLAERLYFQDDLDAARNMVLAHLRFVVHIARSYTGYGLPLGDLIQEGNVGLMKAVKRFDPNKGVRLVSFAVHWIKAEIHEYVIKNWRIVKVATTKAQRKLFFNLRSQKKRLAWLNQDEVNRVAADLNVKPEVVMEMESRLSGQDVGFDLTSDDDDDKPYLAPAAFLESHSDSPDLAAESEDLEDHYHEVLFEGMDQLDDRSKDIIQSRWLIDPKITLQELADKYGVSAERIRQLEAVAMKKLKAHFSA